MQSMGNNQPIYSDLLHPPRRDVSYGCVLVDAARKKVLLRKPHGGHLGYVWTFAKGKPDEGESPEQTALRETREEYGRLASLLVPLPQWYYGPKWANWFWLAEDAGEAPDGLHWETEAVRWFTWDEAVKAIRQTGAEHRRDRDLEILAAARKLALR
jgi:8-oxo-dGTP pyrophosphatase MutT (NUDIX family)